MPNRVESASPEVVTSSAVEERVLGRPQPAGLDGYAQLDRHLLPGRQRDPCTSADPTSLPPTASRTRQVRGVGNRSNALPQSMTTTRTTLRESSGTA